MKRPAAGTTKVNYAGFTAAVTRKVLDPPVEVQGALFDLHVVTQIEGRCVEMYDGAYLSDEDCVWDALDVLTSPNPYEWHLGTA